MCILVIFFIFEFISFLDYRMYFFFFRVNLFKLISFYFQIIKYQVKKNEHFHQLLFAFSQGSTAAIAACDICAVYGEGAIAVWRGCHSCMERVP